MATNDTNPVLQTLRRAALRCGGPEMTDGQLLGRFIEGRDEIAFETLVRRLGPIVLGVCRRLLRHGHDAEDAFQAVFIVLARKAASIRKRELVGNWLYGVAYQTALKARRAAARRQARERQAATMREPEPADRHLLGELLSLLDQELNQLPDKYRIPIVLCELEGLTHKEAAGRLGCAEGTVSSRLSRARTMLAKRLSRCGLAVTAGALAAALARNAASAGVPPTLASATVKAGALAAAGAALVGIVSAKTALLANGMMKTLFLAKLRVAGVVLLLACLLAVGTGAVACQILAADPRRPDPAPLAIAQASFASGDHPGARLDQDAQVDEIVSAVPMAGQTYLLINEASGRCMSVCDQEKIMAAIVLGPLAKDSGPAEQWKFTRVGDVDKVGDYFQLTNVNSGMALTVPQGQKYASVHMVQERPQGPNTGQRPVAPGKSAPHFNLGGSAFVQTRVEDQMWQLVKTGKRYAIQSHQTDMALGVAPTFNSLEPIEQHPFAGNPDQSWILRQASEVTKP